MQRLVISMMASAISVMTIASASGAVIVDSGLNGTAQSNLSAGSGKTVGFRLGTAAALGNDGYTLDSITVRLRSINRISADANTVFALYSSTTTGNIKPATLITNFTDPMFVASGVADNTSANFTLTPETPVTLLPGEGYWIVGYNTSTVANELIWLVDGASATTAAGVTAGSGTGTFPSGWFPATAAQQTSPGTWSSKSSVSTTTSSSTPRRSPSPSQPA